MIIQCPNCETKFSIATELLEATSEPRFHCSRCEHEFALDSDTDKLLATNLLGEPPQIEENEPDSAESDWELGTSEQQDLDEDLVASEEIVSEPALNPPTGLQLSLIPETGDSSEPSSHEPTKTISSFLETSDEPVVAAAWPDSSHESMEYTADMSELLEKTLTSEDEVEGLQTRAAKREEFLSLLGSAEDAVSSLPEEEEAQPELSLSSSTTIESSDSSEPIFERSHLEVTTPSVDALVEPQVSSFEVEDNTLASYDSVLEAGDFFSNSPNIDDLDTDEDVLGEIEREYSDYEPRWNTGLAPLMAVLLFPAIICTGLWLAKNQLIQHPALADAILSLVQTEHLEAPPEGLNLANVRPQIVSLDDGRNVFEIAGAIQNNTAFQFDRIKIQATIYSEDNQQLRSVIVDADNGLTSVSRLGSLAPKDIDSLQRRRALGSATFEPNGSADFRIVLTEDETRARWFSTQIHSVDYQLAG